MARGKGIKLKKNSSKKNKTEKGFNSFNLMAFFIFGLFLFFIAYVEGEHLWKFVHEVFLGFFGVLAIFIGPVYVCVAVFYSIKTDKLLFKKNIYEIFALLLIICAIVQTYDCEEAVANLSFFERLQNLKTAWLLGLSQRGGGVVGEFISLIFSYFFGRQVAFLIFWVFLFFLFFMVTGISFAKFVQFLVKPFKNVKIDQSLLKKNSSTNSNEKNLNEVKNNDSSDEFSFDEKFNGNEINELAGEVNKSSLNLINSDNNSNNNNNNNYYFEKGSDENELKQTIEQKKALAQEHESENSNNIIGNIQYVDSDDMDNYVFPSIGLLNKPVSENNVDVSVELKANAVRLVDTLKSFGVETRIINISRGPAVTRYELQPSAGVKISKITNLADDISLNLAAGGVRIEAPIPNKSAVGIEVPNKKKETVVLREIVSSDVFVKAKSPLTFALGKDIAGNVVVADIEKMPHVLIAGATGSGKSVCINSLIVSLIYKSSPKNVRLLLIDPKVVELGVYNDIAHLLIPVVTDPKKAAGALNWAVNEMLKRYKLFASVGVRDLKSYNSMLETKSSSDENAAVLLPQIVIIVDELADLMMAASKEVENSICRLAQMARAAGMHLVIATQRPSVDVITGLIKANVPSRIAFTVSSQVDSRTIIDMAGAEKLLGKGDMLYFPVGQQKPTRVQGCFLSDGEVERVVASVKVSDQTKMGPYGDEIMTEIARHAEKSDELEANFQNAVASSGDDSVFSAAAKLVVESGQASISFLQRKLKLGYSRAARIMDELEQAGVVSEPGSSGLKGRKVLMTKQQLLEMNLTQED